MDIADMTDREALQEICESDSEIRLLIAGMGIMFCCIVLEHGRNKKKGAGRTRKPQVAKEEQEESEDG